VALDEGEEIVLMPPLFVLYGKWLMKCTGAHEHDPTAPRLGGVAAPDVEARDAVWQPEPWVLKSLGLRFVYFAWKITKKYTKRRLNGFTAPAAARRLGCGGLHAADAAAEVAAPRQVRPALRGGDSALRLRHSALKLKEQRLRDTARLLSSESQLFARILSSESQLFAQANAVVVKVEAELAEEDAEAEL
jgi:hypothetical protein